MSLLKKIYKHLIIIVILELVTIGCGNQEKQEALKSNIISPPKNQDIWEGEMVYFEGAASGGTPPYTYSWKFGAGIPPSKKKIPGETLFNYEGAYNVRLTVKDSKGHVNTDSVRIVVKRKEVFK